MLTAGITCLFFTLIGMGVAIGGAYTAGQFGNTNLVTTNYNSTLNTLTFTNVTQTVKIGWELIVGGVLVMILSAYFGLLFIADAGDTKTKFKSLIVTDLYEKSKISFDDFTKRYYLDSVATEKELREMFGDIEKQKKEDSLKFD